MVAKLDGPRAKPASGGAPKSLVVLLHGVGADGDDLIGLAPYLAPLLPDTEFLAPNGPYPCDMAPFGRQWFSLQDRNPAVLGAGVAAAAPVLDAFLNDALKARNLDGSRLALLGFSQGTMMALQLGPRRAVSPAGIVGFSGALLAPERLAIETRSRPKTLLIHGDADPVVPFAALAIAEQALRVNRFPVETLVRPGLGHGIDDAGLHRAGAFLKGILG